MGETLICARDGCEETFIRKQHNQIYHSNECCKIVTSQKNKQKYFDKKAFREGLARFCACGTKLSRYNAGFKCGACETRSELERNKQLAGMLTTLV